MRLWEPVCWALEGIGTRRTRGYWYRSRKRLRGRRGRWRAGGVRLRCRTWISVEVSFNLRGLMVEFAFDSFRSIYFILVWTARWVTPSGGFAFAQARAEW